jgi:hypothetical protein
MQRNKENSAARSSGGGEDDILTLAAVLAIHLTEDAEREKTEISARQNDVGTRLSERNALETALEDAHMPLFSSY